MYVAGGCTSVTDCTAATNNVSYTQISVDGVLGAWSSTTANLPSNRTWGQLEAAGNSLYYIGGQGDTATDVRSEVYYGSPSGSTGNVTSWLTAANALPSARTKFGATVWNNRLYVIGGQGTGTGCVGGVCNTVYVSPQLNSGGNISSAWTTTSTSFTVPRSGLTALSYANNIYLFGGFNGTNYLNDSQYAKIDPTNGSVGG
jgi:N-acetylneuraminic acid mutarotase